jgi:hypothetical protein
VFDKTSALKSVSGGDRRRVARPERLLEEGAGDVSKVYFCASRSAGYALLTFSIAWFSFLVFWYQTLSTSKDAPWLFWVFPIGHIGVGFGTLRHALIQLLNRTEVVVSPTEVIVRDVPIPNRRKVIVDRAAIEQVFCRREEHKNSDGNVSFNYSVLVSTKAGEDQVIFPSLPLAEEALYIEQFIEARLGVVDTPVAGELAQRG